MFLLQHPPPAHCASGIAAIEAVPTEPFDDRSQPRLRVSGAGEVIGRDHRLTTPLVQHACQVFGCCGLSGATGDCEGALDELEHMAGGLDVVTDELVLRFQVVGNQHIRERVERFWFRTFAERLTNVVDRGVGIGEHLDRTAEHQPPVPFRHEVHHLVQAQVRQVSSPDDCVVGDQVAVQFETGRITPFGQRRERAREHVGMVMTQRHDQIFSADREAVLALFVVVGTSQRERQRIGHRRIVGHDADRDRRFDGLLATRRFEHG